MSHTNQDIIDRYFEAYGKHDIDGIRKVMQKNTCVHLVNNQPDPSLPSSAHYVQQTQ